MHWPNDSSTYVLRFSLRKHKHSGSHLSTGTAGTVLRTPQSNHKEGLAFS